MRNCIDEGTLQAFLDNELDAATTMRVTRHLAECDSCAELLAVVEEETALVFGALEPELNTLVPTERLWTKINQSLEGERKGWFASLRLLVDQLSMPALASFASLVIVAGTFVFFISNQGEAPALATGVRSPMVSLGTIAHRQVPEQSVEPADDESITAVRASYTHTDQPRAIVAPRPAARLIDGEEPYVRTISKLQRSVDQNKDSLLSPTARFAYERDLAVVNDAIRRVRDEVKRNPKSDIAKQVLFTSYQNKIDLLNSVNERGELMASIGR